MNANIDERFQVSPFLVFFLIAGSQIGIGITKFQKDIAEGAGYDAWVAVILSGISIQIILWMIYRMLKMMNNEVFYINQFCFGKWLGGAVNVIVIAYVLLQAVLILRSYIEVVQVWMFPLIKTWQISTIFLVLLYYIVTGGFRVIVGICFWCLSLPFLFLFPLVFFPLEFAQLNNLLPLFNHSFIEMVRSSKSMLFQFLGFEYLLLYYPFIKNGGKSQKWAHFGVLFSTCLYLIITIITFLFYSEPHLKHHIWPTLSMLKIVELPFIERFEYIVVSLCCLTVLPNISISLWAACRSLKKLAKIKQRVSLIIILILMFAACQLLKDHNAIQQSQKLFSYFALYFIYLYIPIIFGITIVRKKFSKSMP
ncbi:GerAB/ArcD/ProY family transporter [Paenibacillus sp. sgz302251]|uniref:GerAB/ArcD/ProY family transporter n=1 Tax=Paenibacillus sp. sgz302251 TaxID=3414493 RepID=UPI003C7B98E1